MATTATDYQWINDHSDLAEAYCAVLVRGVTVQQFLRGMRAEPQGTISGTPRWSGEPGMSGINTPATST